MAMGSRTTGLCMAAMLTAAPAVAGDLSHADLFGNLVVESDAGYKRIIVGQARNAEDLARYLAADRGTSDEDGAFADSLGNVTARSTSGLKRILVGRADQVPETAGEYSATSHARGWARRAPIVCAPADGVIRGRSHMYGLDRGQTPVIVDCE